ncbi:MAG: serine/threonine protein kinase, partial [Deltaproteobacteria bacterium]|nr:serine/threonine protein kinase [Deltaproteobacteria bacterium]
MATQPTQRDGGPREPLDAEQLLAGRYRLRGVLGSGGMGTVYRAYDLELGELIALKIVSRGVDRDEVRLARRVTHPNVARTFDVGEHGELRFITMELIDGGTLSDVLDHPPPLAIRIAVAAQIARGLAAIHAGGIVHRDLKPDNVLVTTGGVAKITDFGIARTADATRAGMGTGTANYIAPEVLAGARPTVAADVFALGLVIRQLVTGEPAEAATGAEVALLH